MGKYIKELIIILLQLLIFYILPLFAGPTDTMGLVVLIIFFTFVLAIFMGDMCNKKIVYIYPLLISILFIPSIFIYYNESALIHSVWYFVVSSIGLLIGKIIKNK